MSHEPKASDTIPTMTRLEPKLHQQVSLMATEGDRSISRQIRRLVIAGMKNKAHKKGPSQRT